MSWRTKSRYNKEWRERSRLACVVASIPRIEKIRITGIIFRRNLGVSDADNDLARLKPLVDGIRDARVIKNDTRAFVFWSPTEERHGERGVWLIIKEALPCTRCGSYDEVSECLLNTRFCLSCYGLLVTNLFKESSDITVGVFLKRWLELGR